MSEQETSDQQAPPATGFAGLAESIGTRNLWIIILAMPAVFLVIIAAIIMMFGKPGDEEAAAAPVIEESAVAAPVPETLPAEIAIPAGAAPGAIALDGDRLAVRLDGHDGVEVVIYDLAKGEVVARVPFRTQD